jgi:prepilin-type N-terminal cleavage/methylation domain-containing protein
MKKKQKMKRAFTLIELLIVIAIIGILASVVLVSTRSGVDKAKRASALTTASSALPEIVACQDDGFGTNAWAAGGGTKICNDASHTVTWPDTTSTGWTIVAAASAVPVPDAFTYTVHYVAGGQADITCSLSANMCQ